VTRALPCRVTALTVADAGEALTVQYAAYLAEARRYGTTEIPPLRETVSELAADLGRPDVLGFAARIGPRLVGSVRLRGLDGDPVEFARYSVAPDLQGHGVGTALMAAAHAALPAGKRAWLVTGVQSEANLRLYRRAGYVGFAHLVDSAGVELVRMVRAAA